MWPKVPTEILISDRPLRSDVEYSILGEIILGHHLKKIDLIIRLHLMP